MGAENVVIREKISLQINRVKTEKAEAQEAADLHVTIEGHHSRDEVLLSCHEQD